MATASSSSRSSGGIADPATSRYPPVLPWKIAPGIGHYAYFTHLDSTPEKGSIHFGSSSVIAPPMPGQRRTGDVRPVVVPDVRFENEVRTLAAHGFTLRSVESPCEPCLPRTY
ncbi:hypothetical protein [Streptomyces syringium]|uniref:Uncharacterized protein n=1 Tax=Streptomyces syringium TaxID=76729 RepID=A0ABS4XVP1_9ACTN|nr:hypothetical protein [Streptomyces syringium]MBP2400586.1 hypothetical protein [Streptomyces syringium]